MDNQELYERLKQLKIEDFIWIIYIGIIILSLYSNVLERKYFINNDINSKEKYRNINIIIFSILIVVYLYFVKDAYDSFKKLNKYDSEKKKNLTLLSLIGAVLIAISGFIFLYISIVDENIDVEIAFA